IVLAFAIAARGGVTTDHPQVDGSIDDATSPDASDDAAIHFGDDASALPPVRPCPTSEPAAGTPCASQKNLCEYGSSSNVLCNT
ncbi:hypothetical protein C1Y26_35165, partial [Pseudomonas sp. MPR-R2A7]|uniref:hypothetical protein n=1 Tax=Pseudomonas sp. MPR-R2A7 TaxID=2070618 RepID=UPI000CC433B2